MTTTIVSRFLLSLQSADRDVAGDTTRVGVRSQLSTLEFRVVGAAGGAIGNGGRRAELEDLNWDELGENEDEWVEMHDRRRSS